MRDRGTGWLRDAAAAAAYLLIAAVYTRPLLALRGTHVASDPGDPILNASILWWNATTLPFSTAWWNAPYFYPSRDVSAFTENLVGISPIATPVFWLTGNPLTAYNVALYLTWPLSALGAYLLVTHLTMRRDAGFIAGLAYGFSPYRLAELGHLQMVSSYWLPVALLGLHGYLKDRRPRWLGLFAVAWLLQSLSNGYLTLFGGVLVGVWLLYFCTARGAWRAAPPILGAWALASVPVVVVMLKYRAVLAWNGLRRDLTEAIGLSVPIHAWGEVSDLVWLWHRVFPNGADNLFPGVTALIVVVFGAVAALRQPGIAHGTSPVRRRTRAVLGVVAGLSLLAIVYTLLTGPWSVTIGAHVLLRTSNLERAATLLVLAGTALVVLTPRARDAVVRRSPLVFYAAATLAMAVFSFGPVLSEGTDIVLDPAPYRWLMALPGFNQVRVPTRFWMPGILCLATAAGLAYVKLVAASSAGRRLATGGVVAAALLADGWIRNVPMAEPPEAWAIVEPAGVDRPILELPLGPDWDAAATFRSMHHRRRVVNGVSGFDPLHYAPLQAGLGDRDPQMLPALASFGAIDVVVNGAADPDGAWTRYVLAVNGVEPIASDGTRRAYRIPAFEAAEPVLGEAWPVAGTDAFGHDASVIADGRVETEWGDHPQRPGQWVSIDLGRPQTVAGVSHALGEYARDFPRRLAIDLSLDGSSWDEVWQGPTAARAFRAAVLAPREAVMRFAFEARPARFVRLRQLADHGNMWRVAELRAHAPVR